MNKIDKYLRRFAYKIETSETKESRYYTIGDSSPPFAANFYYLQGELEKWLTHMNAIN